VPNRSQGVARPKTGKFEGAEVIFLEFQPPASNQDAPGACFEAWLKYFAIGSNYYQFDFPFYSFIY